MKILIIPSGVRHELKTNVLLSVSGVLVEVEYQPCSVPANCWGLLAEFARGFLGSAVSEQIPPYLHQRANDLYTPVDTVQQYLEHFNAFRKGGPQQQQQQRQ